MRLRSHQADDAAGHSGSGVARCSAAVISHSSEVILIGVDHNGPADHRVDPVILKSDCVVHKTKVCQYVCREGLNVAEITDVSLL